MFGNASHFRDIEKKNIRNNRKGEHIMLISKVNNPKELDKALKNLKNKVIKTGLISELRDRKEYKKPSIRKREEKSNAIYKQKLKDIENNK